MRPADALAFAAANLLAHRLRSALTMLGMTFGVGAVIAMLSIGEGAESESLRLIERMGLRNVVVRAKAVREQDKQEVRKKSLGLSPRDAAAILEAIPQAEAVAPRVVIEPKRIRAGTRRTDGVGVGVSPDYASMIALQVAEGRLLDAHDDRDHAQHCVLGAGARRDLFPGDTAVGRFVQVDDLWCEVVGVLRADSVGSSSFQGVSLGSSAQEVLLPLSTVSAKAARNLLDDPLDEIVVAIRPGEDVTVAARALSALMDRLHGGASDWELVVPELLLQQSQRTQRLFNIVMGAIASISLLVGGIGIMNIMLASVLEQTREIGVRRAVGATRGDIRVLFLTSAFLLSAAGGLAGVALGLSLSGIVSASAGWPTVHSASSILLSTSVSAAIGLASGLYPAHRAANLDPMEALRYE